MVFKNDLSFRKGSDDCLSAVSREAKRRRDTQRYSTKNGGKKQHLYIRICIDFDRLWKLFLRALTMRAAGRKPYGFPGGSGRRCARFPAPGENSPQGGKMGAKGGKRAKIGALTRKIHYILWLTGGYLFYIIFRAPFDSAL
jgi:hypothetical protein